MPTAVGEIFHRLGYYRDNIANLETATASALASGDRRGQALTHHNYRRYSAQSAKLRFRTVPPDDRETVVQRDRLTTSAARPPPTTSPVSRWNRASTACGIAGLRRRPGRAARRSTCPVPKYTSSTASAEAHRRAHDLDMAISYAQEGLLAGHQTERHTESGRLPDRTGPAPTTRRAIWPAHRVTRHALSAVHIVRRDRSGGAGRASCWRPSTVIATNGRPPSDTRGQRILCSGGWDPKGQAVAKHTGRNSTFTGAPRRSDRSLVEIAEHFRGSVANRKANSVQQ